MSDIVSTDHRVALAAGRVFARQWQPVDVARDAVPLLLLHDSLGCVELWRDLPARLAIATGRRVIAYDRLGFGRSDARAGRPSLDFVAEEASTSVSALRAQLGFDRFVAVGHSVGGGMAVEIAAQCPGDGVALVTIAAQAFVEERTLIGLRAARAQFADPRQVERLARYHGDKAAWALDAWLGQWLDPAFADWSLAQALPRVTCPVLAIHGAQDEYGSAAHPTRIVDGVRGPARIELMAGVGHFPHRERPEAVVLLIADFLARVEQSD